MAAEVLKVGANPGVGAKVLGLATVVGGAFKFITSGLRSLPEDFTIGGFFGERGIAFFGYGFLARRSWAWSYIVGLNVAILIAAGGLFSWWLAIPLFNSFFFNQDPVLLHELIGLDPEAAAYAIWRCPGQLHRRRLHVDGPRCGRCGPCAIRCGRRCAAD